MKNLLIAIANLMNEQELPCLLIGGHAVTSLGHPRATFDIDLLIPRSAREDWQRNLLPLGYTVFAASDQFIQLEPQPDWPLPAIDLMLVDQEVFDSLDGDRHEGFAIPTPNITAMVALKLHATQQASRSNKDQDWSDILALVDLGVLTLDDPEFSAIVNRHGGSEAISRIEAHLARRDQL